MCVFPGEGYSSRMSAPVPQPISVNFNVVIDASGNLEVFNAAAPVVTNVLVAEHTLPVKALYDPDNTVGLLELWEPENAQGDIHVQLADTDRTASGGLNFVGAYQAASKRIASGLETILCDKFDCSGAAPFSAYTGNVEYYKQRDFGRIALATYAHHLFGHVDATAAITNDKAFVEAMLSCSAGGDNETAEGAAARAAAWTKSTAANVQLWDQSASSSDANLAIRLVKTLVGKGLNGSGIPTVSSVNAGEPDSLANIVSQVVGQDASRLMNVDMSQRTRDQHILLRFYPGDVIYMNITLKSPNVNIGSTNQLVSKAALEAMYPQNNNNFTLKITLGANPIPESGFTGPSSLSNLAVWLDGLDPLNTGVQPTNGTSISTWADKAGLGYSASGGPFPYETNGLLISGPMNFITGVPFPTQQTVFMVAYSSTYPQMYYNFATNNPASSPAFIANYDGSKLEYFNGSDRATFASSPSGAFVAAYTYAEGVAVNGYYNASTPVFTIPQTTSLNYHPYTSIGSPQVNARICEYIIYSRVLTNTEMVQVIDYLKAKYAI